MTKDNTQSWKILAATLTICGCFLLVSISLLDMQGTKFLVSAILVVLDFLATFLVLLFAIRKRQSP